MNNLPQRWDMVPLGKLGKYINGRAFKPTEWEHQGLPIIRIQNLTDPSKPYNYYSRPVESKYYVKNGDLLVSWSATLGVYIWDRGDAILNQHIFKVIVNEDRVEKEFLRYAIHHAIGDLMEQTHGATMKHVTKGKFEAFDVPIPRSKTEQRRIIARIEALMGEVREARRINTELMAYTGRLMESATKEVLDDGEELGWGWQTIKDLITKKPQYGTSTKANIEGKGIPLIRMGNIQDGKLVLDDLKHVELSDNEHEKYRTKSGDILFNRTNSAELVGKTAVVHSQDDMVFASYIIRICVDENVNDPDYISIFINSPYGRYYIQEQLVRAIGQVNVNAQKLIAMPILVPNALVEQKRISRYISQLHDEILVMKADQSITEIMLTQMEQSILRQAFRGEL